MVETCVATCVFKARHQVNCVKFILYNVKVSSNVNTNRILLKSKTTFLNSHWKFPGEFMDMLILFWVLGLQTELTLWLVCTLFPSIPAVTWILPFYPADVFLTCSKGIKAEPDLSSTTGPILQLLLVQPFLMYLQS